MSSQPIPVSPPTSSQPASNRAVTAILVGGTLLALALLVLAVATSERSISATINVFSTRFLGIFIEAVPFLLLGTLVSGMIGAFVRHDDIARLIPRNRVLATFGGAFLGLLFPVCECGVVPVTRRLFTKGLPLPIGITFLLAAPFMNPIVFASTFIAFGFGPVFLLRFLVTATVAISVGLLFAFFAHPEDVLLPAAQEDPEACALPPPRPQFLPGMRAALLDAGGEFFEMGRYLIVGSMLAAAMQTFVPQEALVALGAGPVISVLAMQVLAFVLSVCSTVDAFIALAFTTTFSLGGIVAFLSFGPMVDIKSTMMFLGVFQRRIVFYLIALPFLMNLFAGIAINLLVAG
jgi:uncharacterized protein